MMSLTARVNSVAAIQDCREALCKFGAELREALDTASMELRRTCAWLEEQLRYWQKDIHRRQDEVAQAKLELHRRKLFKIGDHEPDCIEQENALRLARQRLRHAEERAASCRRWRTLLPRAVGEYEGPARRLASWLESQFAQALALLDRKHTALDAYVTLPPPPQAGAELERPEP